MIIDEVQDVWPARSNGSQVPPNVAWLNTHRHLGVDIFVLTQNPKNIDVNLRGLVNKHLHVAKNKLGIRTLLEWKYCANNPLTQAKDAFAKVHKLDKKNLWLLQIRRSAYGKQDQGHQVGFCAAHRVAYHARCPVFQLFFAEKHGQ